MANKQYFSVFDAVKGYHQVDIDEEDQYKTVFICHCGLFQYKRLPFGLKNAPGQYQRLMDRVLGSLRWTAALCYIDDAIVFSNSWAEHVDHVRRFLTAIRASGLQLSATKCKIVYPDVTMLGMQISRYGLATTKDKVAAVTDLPTPTTMAALHRVVGMFGYYRNFIENFLCIARPLNDLKKASGKYAPGAKIIWTDECKTALKKLKSQLSSTPILAHPKYDRTFILHTDASKDGFGAVLSQIWTADDYRVAESSDGRQERTPDAAFPDAGFTGLDRTPDVAFDRMRTPVSSLSVSQDMTSFTTVVENSDWTHAYQCDPAFSSIYRSLQAGSPKAGT